MLDFNEFLEHLKISIPNASKRGFVFERHYCKWFLQNDPGYAAQLKNVWLWDEWPGNWGREKGIDLIAETHTGHIWAIQAKAYDESYYITKADIDGFLSESSRKEISYRLLIATTNHIGFNSREVLKGQEKQVGLCLLNDLEASDLDWSSALANNNVRIQHDPKIPWPHQEKAISDIMKGFETSSRGQLHMACGTGKTLVGLWLAKRVHSQNTLVLVPSISLIAQLYREWSQNAGDFMFDPIFVCSDDTVAKDNEDQISTDSTLSGFPVTTAAVDIIKEYKLSSRSKVIFSTYHSSPIISQACALDTSLCFDLVIADEAHRCAGSSGSAFATITNKHAIRATRKLYMTATPKIFSENVKKKTQECAHEIASMDDEEKFGPVFHTLLFSEAIKQNLLTNYEVIIPVMDHDTYRDYAERGRLVACADHETDARTLASQIFIAKTVKKYGLKKVISFHNRTSAAKNFIQTFSKSLFLLDDNERPVITYQEMIFGDMQQSERCKILKQFGAVSVGTSLIANVKCLSEGVDVPAIDTIVFVDPKGSEIDIVQAIGRVMRKSENKKIGRILIPIFVDGISDEEQVLEKSCFKPIWQVVRALRSHDDILAEELDNFRLELGKRTYKNPPTLGNIKFDIMTKVGTDFAQTLSVKTIQNCAQVALAQSHPELSLKWHPTKNEKLTPDHVTTGSHKKIWWKCEKYEDHIWEAAIASIVKSFQNNTKTKGCPFCQGAKVAVSNCLATMDPEISQSWCYKKNTLTPFDVTKNSNKKVWWKCDKGEDHIWETSVNNRVKQGCPYCSGKKVSKTSSLSYKIPNLAKEWHEKNNLTPQEVTLGSNKNVWWLCEKGHEYSARIAHRVSGSGCPFCFGKKLSFERSLEYKCPELAEEWHPVKNGDINPSMVHASAKLKVWWMCKVDNTHEWESTIDNRYKGNGCSGCRGLKVVLSNCLATTHPELAKQWHPTKNEELTPYQVTAGSGRKVWWKCDEADDHEWDALISKRSNGTGCPRCIGR